jgi:glutamine---fructose-6-phosphate transaminase (isomerizing)
MCGIVGYVGPRPAQRVILSGLKRLEYRGYDSSGLAVLSDDGAVEIRRHVGKLDQLLGLVNEQPLGGHLGIGHTRWATHGAPIERNAHPHRSMHGQIVLVHNGIVENYLQLRDELQSEGISFDSDTDTEVIVQMAERYLESGDDFGTAMRRVLGRLHGSNAVVAISTKDPEKLVCARLGNAGGITLGLGEGEMFIASDIPAILEHTRDMVFLENGQVAEVTRTGFVVTDLSGAVLPTETHTIPWDPVSAVKGEFKHFMQKEIFEQPRALVDTLRGRVDFEHGRLTIPELDLTERTAQSIRKLYIVACGTSYYAGLVGKYMIESLARIPVEVEYGSEFRYYRPIIDEGTAVLSITQSGETADTLAAVDLARQQGALIWTIVNVIGSQSMRTADGFIAMHAGPEIGVASTKAFTTALADLFMLGVMLGQLRGVIDRERVRQLLSDLARLPDQAGRVLDNNRAYEDLAGLFFKADNFLFLGRGINYPVAMEGALKLKEISYIHAEGYPAGEMKHGPIALIDETMPVVAVVPRDELYEKMVSQIEQAKTRGGIVIALATEGDEEIRDKADHVLYVPATQPLFTPIINVIPLQLLAYHIAVRRGCDVDQPRNLAKSVTVE